MQISSTNLHSRTKNLVLTVMNNKCVNKIGNENMDKLNERYGSAGRVVNSMISDGHSEKNKDSMNQGLL